MSPDFNETGGSLTSDEIQIGRSGSSGNKHSPLSLGSTVSLMNE
jgi:hypothetical protein